MAAVTVISQKIDLRTQKVLIWTWVVMSFFFMIAYALLMRMFPPPSPRWTADRIAQFYIEHGTSVRFGAVVMSVVSAFFIPFIIVVVAQMLRHEAGRTPVLSMLAGGGGVIFSIFTVLPPLFWGAAAFTPTRSPDVTAAIHELGLLMFFGTAEFFIFPWLAVAAVCLIPNSVPHSPFPRWFGYFTLWDALAVELGAFCFLFKSGPFAWNGLMVFWVGASTFFLWMVILTVLMLKAINRQLAEAGPAADSALASSA